jgi:sugar/nucleoside kinase (ribokinase family)
VVRVPELYGRSLGGLLVVGDVVTDIVALHGTPLATGTDTAAHTTVRPGGSAANAAAWAADRGARVTLLGRVGADSADWHRTALEACGVRTRLHIDPVASTAVVIALVDRTGERTMVTDRGAGGLLGPADWDAGLLRGVARLHLSGYLFFTDQGLALARLALDSAREAGVAVSVDPASTGFLRSFGVRRFLAETAAASLILPNQDEAALLTGEERPEVAARLLSDHYGVAVVKAGPAGALCARGGVLLEAVPAPVATAIDSTGAGDAFAGAFLAADLAGADLVAAARAGCSAGAEAVTLLGGRPAAAARQGVLGSGEHVVQPA